MTDTEFRTLCGASDRAFARVLFAMRHTGCRPGEIRSLIWEWVDLEAGLWVLPDHKTITKQREPTPRYVPLSPDVVTLCEKLREESKPALSDYVFLNAHGESFTKDALCRKMARIRKRAGIAAKAGEQLVLYSNRHTFGTEAAGQVSDIDLAGLLGHTDVRTTQRYVHLRPDRLKAIRHRLDRQAQESAWRLERPPSCVAGACADWVRARDLPHTAPPPTNEQASSLSRPPKPIRHPPRRATIDACPSGRP